jgi:hypothetical protein
VPLVPPLVPPELVPAPPLVEGPPALLLVPPEEPELSSLEQPCTTKPTTSEARIAEPVSEEAILER